MIWHFEYQSERENEAEEHFFIYLHLASKNVSYLWLELVDSVDKLDLLASFIFLLDGDLQPEISHLSRCSFE